MRWKIYSCSSASVFGENCWPSPEMWRQWFSMGIFDDKYGPHFFPSFFFVSEWKSFIICKKSFEPSSFALWRIHHLHRAFDSMTAKKNRIIFSFFHEHFELNYSSTFTIFWHVSLGGQIQQIFPNSLLFLLVFI